MRLRKLKVGPIKTRPSQYSNYRDFLQALYLEMKTEKPEFTYVDLSVMLGLSATGFVHQRGPEQKWQYLAAQITTQASLIIQPAMSGETSP